MQLTDALTHVISQLGPVSRRSAMREIAQYLRRTNSKRINRNVQADGSKMEARKNGSAKMYRKMDKYLKAKSSAAGAEVGFSGSAGRIASTHQLGKVLKHRDTFFRLPVRTLLGLPREDRDAIRSILLKHIGLSA